MTHYKMTVTKMGMPPIDSDVSVEFVDRLRKYMVDLPYRTNTGRTDKPVTELLLLKTNYQKVLNSVQELLRDDKIASETVSLIEAIESDHIAILFYSVER